MIYKSHHFDIKMISLFISIQPFKSRFSCAPWFQYRAPRPVSYLVLYFAERFQFRHDIVVSERTILCPVIYLRPFNAHNAMKLQIQIHCVFFAKIDKSCKRFGIAKSLILLFATFDLYRSANHLSSPILSHLFSDPISTQLSNLSITSETIMVNPPKKRYVIKNTNRSGATKIFFIISTLTFTLFRLYYYC